MSNESKYPLPRIKEAHGATVFYRDIRQGLKANIQMWEGATKRQRYYVWFEGYFHKAGPYERRLMYSDILAQREIDAGVLEVSVTPDKYQEFIDQRKIFIRFGVNFSGSTEEEATRFNPFHGYMLVKDTFKDKTDFYGDNLYGWLPGPDVDPRDLTFETVNGKRCLHYPAKDDMRFRTILFKDISVVAGRRYYFTASACAPGVSPQKGVVIYLRESESNAIGTLYGSGEFYSLGWGVTAKSNSIRLQIVADNQGALVSRGFYISDIALYEFNDENNRWWDEEWDVDWPSNDPQPPKDPEVELLIDA